MTLFSFGPFLLEFNHQFLLGIDYVSRDYCHGSIGLNFGPLILSFHWVMSSPPLTADTVGSQLDATIRDTEDLLASLKQQKQRLDRLPR